LKSIENGQNGPGEGGSNEGGKVEKDNSEEVLVGDEKS